MTDDTTSPAVGFQVEREVRRIHCCGCGGEADARLTDGREMYPHRPDLHSLPFWRCDACGNFVGCHHKTKNRTKPLGCIPTPELKEARTIEEARAAYCAARKYAQRHA